MRQAMIWAAAGLIVLAAPALADTKAGWDAWQRGDYKTAVEEWRGPAVAGDADAQFNLGQAYKLGRGVPVDPGLAESWFRKAALQHHPLAEDNYGLALYQAGRRREAVPWLEKSVLRGEPRTQLVLGTMLFNGDDVPRDVPRAYALMTRASQSGLKAASETLAQMDPYVSPADRQKGTTLAQQLAASQANASAAAGREGIVVSTDGPRPIELPPSQAAGPVPSRPAPATPAPATPAPAPVRATAKTEPVTAGPKPAPASNAGTKVAAAAPAPAPRPAPVKAAPPPKPTPPQPVPAKPVPAKPVPAKPAPAASGRVRVQLGAFRDEGNARALWSRVGSRIGGTPSYVKVGELTRLIGGAFASEGDAQRACKAAGISCVIAR